MRLVADGWVDLESPVRRYVPELQLADEQTATEVTVLNLVNHTSGLDWDLLVDTGDGDDALERYVARLPELELIARPGTRTSYSQAAYSLLGRVLETVTGAPYEKAIASLIFEPVGLTNSFFSADDVMTRRFSVGHNRAEDGKLSVSRLWRGPRCRNPGAGVSASAADLLRWGRFHLGDGRSDRGEEVLAADLLEKMRRPTAELRASSLGDAVGIGWFLRDVGGVPTAGHGGSAIGQFAEFLTVPDRGFVVAAMSNATDGIQCNQAIVRWALETYLGMTEGELETAPHDEERAQSLVGHYENDAMTIDITSDGARLVLETLLKPEVRAALDSDPGPDYPPAAIGLLPGDVDEYVITEGGLKGARGFFSRDESSAVVGIDLAGRLFSRVSS
jgi:CubicO group peptidase (beta-lactamase class C family)